jgi:TM2 domain-containing membrane protein YozV
MERRSKFLTFILALIPGVGQIYLGLFRKGIQLLILFILLGPVLGMIGLGFVGSTVKLLIWCYAFFDTFDIARRLDKGEKVKDSDYIINKYVDRNGNGESGSNFKGHSFDKNFWLFCGWGLIIVGILAIVNLMFGTNDLYGQIKSYISTYFIPALLVLAGVYMLLRGKR